jgi:adenylate kinase family enzyme
MKILYILRGLPGSGKSTLAKSLSNALTGHIEADMFFVDKESGEYRFDPTKLGQAHSWCKETVEKWMGPHGLDT